ncbi:hypothetical protein C0Q70_07396 [Pomacea canaliculata]|uniref:Enoyl-CoA hydratase domain-containing protein 3, mitochondrial n=1 Tax=Pomacea canaliculata TaxID=400727 RepID=A0A2T7PEZ9_POMCA|nr:hypothetical protein C0Q70_07396 [Pomacea canaliculata]
MAYARVVVICPARNKSTCLASCLRHRVCSYPASDVNRPAVRSIVSFCHHVINASPKYNGNALAPKEQSVNMETRPFLMMLTLVLHTKCALGDVLPVHSDVRKCDDPSLPEHFAYARVVDVHPVRSKSSCLASCFRHSLCSHAAYTATSDVSRASCVLFGGQMMRTRRTTGQLGGDSCRFLIMKSCNNGGSFDRGFCSCPETATGQRCEIENSADCLNRWKEMYATNTAGVLVSGEKSILRNISSTLVGSYAKVSIEQGGTYLLLQGKGIYTFGSSTFSLQLSSTFTKQAWNQFEELPSRQFRYVSENGRVQTLNEGNGSVTVQQTATTWYARVPHVRRVIYTFDSSGKPVGTPIADLFKAVKDGKEIIGYSGLRFNVTSQQAVANQFEHDVGSSAIVYGESFQVDSCWTKATQDRTGKENSVGYLIGAILSGHRTRIVVDDLALNVEQVFVVDDTVFFDAGSFMQPADSSTLDSSATSARLVVASDGRVVSCSRRLLPTWDMRKSSYNASFLSWFVHTRQWSRVFTVTTQGEILNGSENALFDAVSRGASLQIGLTLENSSSYRYLLLTIHSLQLTYNGHVVAEALGLSRLLEVPDVDCVSLAVLVTSQGEVHGTDSFRSQRADHTQETGKEYHEKVFSTCTSVMNLIQDLPVPVIAQVKGLATAAGCQLVATCDIAVASEESRFATPGIHVGVFCTTPGVAVGRVLPRKVALEMMFTGQPISAKDALLHGLISKVVAEEKVEEETLKIANHICQFSKEVITHGKAAFYAQMSLEKRAAYRFAERAMVDNLQLPDAQEGIRAFIEKRPPQWKY